MAGPMCPLLSVIMQADSVFSSEADETKSTSSRSLRGSLSGPGKSVNSARN